MSNSCAGDDDHGKDRRVLHGEKDIAAATERLRSRRRSLVSGQGRCVCPHRRVRARGHSIVHPSACRDFTRREGRIRTTSQTNYILLVFLENVRFVVI